MSDEKPSLYSRMLDDSVIGGIMRQAGMGSLELDPGQKNFQRVLFPGPPGVKHDVSEEVALNSLSQRIGAQPAAVRGIFNNLRLAAEGRGFIYTSDRFKLRRHRPDPDGSAPPRRGGRARRDPHGDQ